MSDSGSYVAPSVEGCKHNIIGACTKCGHDKTIADMQAQMADDRKQALRWRDRVTELEADLAKVITQVSTEKERELAREQYAAGSNDDIEIDDDAKVSEDPETGNVWVQAWVYVRRSE
ncbi:hypothetical protein LP414_27495 [Polaromonas sp. P1(28)-13]|nr:hypothetical protein LP414_27495 [Polaromonas sp. P1(28)-13]